MERILLVGFALISLLGLGAVGTIVTRGYMGMMNGNHRGMGPGGCSMMDNEEQHSMHEEYEEHMEEHCGDITYEECEEMHEECEENMHEYCEHESREGKETGDHCPMMP